MISSTGEVHTKPLKALKSKIWGMKYGRQRTYSTCLLEKDLETGKHEPNLPPGGGMSRKEEV